MTEASQPFGWFLSILLALAVLRGAVRGARGASRLNHVAVVLIGGGLSWLLGALPLVVVYQQSAPAVLDLTQSPLPRLYWWISAGIFWLLLFCTLRHVRLDSWGRRILAVIAVSLASTVYSAVAVGLQMALDLRYPSAPLATRLSESASVALGVMALGMALATSAVQIWVVSAWLKLPQGRPTAPDEVGAVGLKGMVMSKLNAQSTRLLCASVLLGHGGARERLLGWLKDENRAVAPELGVDLRLAAQLARFAEKRSRRDWRIYLAIFCASALASIATAAAWLLGALAAAIVWAARHIEERSTFAPMFRLGHFSPEEVAKRFTADLEDEDVASLPSPDQNFFVYGGFTPFVGAGHDLGGWSVAIALDKPKESFGAAAAIQPFEIRDVYAALDAGLDNLRVSGIQKMDCFFAAGTDVRGDSNLLPNILGRPVQHLDDAVAAPYMYGDDEKVRHYRCYRVLDWGGELALSYYVRCSRRGGSLFIETKRFILTPLASSYRAVDGIVPAGLEDHVAAIFVGLVAGPLFAAVSPFWAVAGISRVLQAATEDRRRRKQIEKNPLFNYGAVTSLRQALSGGVYGHYFQSMDGDLYGKLFEREVLDSLVEFLDVHGIETSDLKERQTTILNTGVMVQGGDVRAESLAVGAGARAVKRLGSALVARAVGKGTSE